MEEVVVIGGRGRGCRRTFGGGWVWVSDTQFSVAKGLELVSPRDCCLVSLIDSRPLRPIRLQLNSAV